MKPRRNSAGSETLASTTTDTYPIHLKSAKGSVIINDEERESFLDEAEKYLRKNFAITEKRVFGPADRNVRESLEELNARAHEKFDLSNNRVGIHVKTGGNVLSGSAIVDTYISYKNTAGQAVVASAYQKTPDDQLMFSVYEYKGSNNTENRTVILKSLTPSEDFYSVYLAKLGETVDQDSMT